MDDQDKLTAFVKRDPTAAIMFAVSIVLIVLTLAAAFARRLDLLQGAMVLMGAFSIAGIVIPLKRTLQRARAAKRTQR